MKINFKKIFVAMMSMIAISAYADKSVKVEIKDLPTRAQEFLTVYFGSMPAQTVVTDKERTEYQVQYPMGLDVEFDKNGNWTKVARNMERMRTEMEQMRQNWQGPRGERPQDGKRDTTAQKERKNRRQQGQPQAGQPQAGQRPQMQRPQGQMGQMGQGRPMGQRGQMGQGQGRSRFFSMDMLLNEPIKTYFKENNIFAMWITSIERFSNGYLITVGTGPTSYVELIFSINGNFIKKTEHTTEAQQ